MIDRARLARAASDADRAVELAGLPAWALARDIELSALMHVAEQRALRSAMLLDGLNPNDRTTHLVKLSPGARALMVPFAGVWIDGLAAGLTIK